MVHDMDRFRRKITVTHWFPIVTFCPVNKLPDMIYVELDFQDEFVELYAARKALRKVVQWRTIYMEDAAMVLAEEFPSASEIRVKLAFNRHTVTLKANK